MSNINPVPQNKIEENMPWREWAVKLTKYIQTLQRGDVKGELVNIPQYTTATAPAYIEGALYYDLTLHKLCIGGATAWETITSV